MPIFCCKVSPPKPSSCPRSCSVSCISPCQQHCCQEHYPPNFLTQSAAICPSQCAIHCDDMCLVHCRPASSEQSSFLKFLTPTGNVQPNFLFIVLFTKLAPVLLHGATKVSIPIQNPGTNITGWKVSCSSRS